MAFTKRRVVTGHNPSGDPVITSDATAAPSILGPSTVNMWYLGERPATAADGGDEPDGLTDFVPPPGGISWRFLVLPPRGGEPAGPKHDPRFDKERVGFHATDTIDFIEIVSGRILLELNDHSVELGPGGCVIQRGTWHRWIVLGDEPCVFQRRHAGGGRRCFARLRGGEFRHHRTSSGGDRRRRCVRRWSPGHGVGLGRRGGDRRAVAHVGPGGRRTAGGRRPGVADAAQSSRRGV